MELRYKLMGPGCLGLARGEGLAGQHVYGRLGGALCPMAALVGQWG